MIVKILTTILVVFNPFAFLVVDKIEPLAQESISIIRWGESLTSSILSANPNFLPIRDWQVNDPEIEAKAALIFDLDKNKILFQKEINRILSIASLTKIMTGLIVLENLDLDQEITISENALTGYGSKGNLSLNEKLSVNDLLHALLMESSNDAAWALAEKTEEKTGQNFVSLMNQKVDQLGLTSTRFSDVSGFKQTNISTVDEIVKLINYSFSQPVIWQIMKKPEIDLAGHHWVNTDELLNRLPNIVGGKTGYTQEAQGCLVLVLEKPGYGKLVTVVLGAQERFLETEKLINWVERAYQW